MQFRRKRTDGTNGVERSLWIEVKKRSILYICGFENAINISKTDSSRSTQISSRGEFM